MASGTNRTPMGCLASSNRLMKMPVSASGPWYPRPQANRPLPEPTRSKDVGGFPWGPATTTTGADPPDSPKVRGAGARGAKSSSSSKMGRSVCTLRDSANRSDPGESSITKMRVVLTQPVRTRAPSTQGGSRDFGTPAAASSDRILVRNAVPSSSELNGSRGELMSSRIERSFPVVSLPVVGRPGVVSALAGAQVPGDIGAVVERRGL